MPPPSRLAIAKAPPIQGIAAAKALPAPVRAVLAVPTPPMASTAVDKPSALPMPLVANWVNMLEPAPKPRVLPRPAMPPVLRMSAPPWMVPSRPPELPIRPDAAPTALTALPPAPVTLAAMWKTHLRTVIWYSRSSRVDFNVSRNFVNAF